MNIDHRVQSNTCFVIGNGPSLRGFDLTRLSSMDTLGMNAAYRHWDLIGWYPDHYACLDDQLMETHHREIRRIFLEGQIKTFFLHGTFFKKYPELIGHPAFISFDQVSKFWFDRLEKEYLEKQELNPFLSQHQEPAFFMSEPSKVTTGSHSVRYAAYLGYRKIGLLGIDLRYIERIPEAVPTSNIGMRIDKTPKSNPNYFFDGYQIEDDLFNIPNPDVHNGELHLQSFATIPADFAKAGVQCEVINCNPKSALCDHNIFPLASVSKLLGQTDLGAIVVPTNLREVSDVILNFKMWDQWDYQPFHYTPRPEDRPALIFSFNNETGKPFEKEITEAFQLYEMDRFFRLLEFKYIGLEGAADIYERDYTKQVGDSGYKSGPNNQFFETMKACVEYGRYIFLMETDCLPIRRGWLSKLNEIVTETEEFWIMGSAYRGKAKLSKNFVRHINGNAIYAAGDAEFQVFIDEFWRPQTTRLVRDVDKRLAYDCILEVVFSEASIQTPEFMAMWKSIAHKLRYTDFIQNISGDVDNKEADLSLISQLRRQSPQTYLLHNRPVQRAAYSAAKIDERRPAPPYPHRVTHTAKPARHPRLLLLDMTPMGDGSANGGIKLNLLSDWTKSQILQVACNGEGGLVLVRPLPDGTYPTTFVTPETALAEIGAFGPEVVLYCPVPDAPLLHEFSMGVIKARNLPVVTWILDNWPARLEVEDPDQAQVLLPDLSKLIKSSEGLLTISQSMSDAFKARYGTDFTHIADGIDPEDWPQPRQHMPGPMLVRYSGGLAVGMTLTSVLRVSQMVEKLANSGVKIKFEIIAPKWWLDESGVLFKNFKHTVIETAQLSIERYRAWLSAADVVIIAYNFDHETYRCVQYSKANKALECMVSGAALLAIGPHEVATIAYLASSGAAHVVDRDEDAAVELALRQLQDSPERRSALSRAGHVLATSRYNVNTFREQLRAILVTASRRTKPEVPLSRPALTELEELRRNFETLGAHAGNLKTQLSSRTVFGPRSDLLSRLSSAEIGDSARMLLTTIGSQLLLQPSIGLARLSDDVALSDGVEMALTVLPDTDVHKVQFLRVRRWIKEKS